MCNAYKVNGLNRRRNNPASLTLTSLHSTACSVYYGLEFCTRSVYGLYLSASVPAHLILISPSPRKSYPCCKIFNIRRYLRLYGVTKHLRINLNWSTVLSSCILDPPTLSVWPHLFCGADHEKRRSWSGPWRLRCTLEAFHVHSYQDQFIQPGWAECVCVCVHI